MNKLLKVLVPGVLVAVVLVAARAADTPTAPATGMSVPLSPDAPSTYVVKRGDTLWSIASHYLQQPWYWPEIWYINPDIKNPHLIYPGDTLHLVYVPGPDGSTQPQVRGERGNTVHLSPQVRAQSLDTAVPAVPYEIVAAFMGKPSVVAKEDLNNLPYIVSIRDNHVAAGMGDDLYARGVDGADPGARFNVVAIGEKLKDPDDGTLLGYMGTYTGSAQVIGRGTVDRKETELTKLKLVDSARETVEGNRLVTDRLEVPLDFIPHAPASQVDGKIIAVVDGVTTIGQYQVVAVNRGKSQGLEPGHVLAIWQRGAKVPDKKGETPGAHREFDNPFPKHVRLPDERTGTLMVFRTYDRMSFGLVLHAEEDMRVGDAVRNP